MSLLDRPPVIATDVVEQRDQPLGVAAVLQKSKALNQRDLVRELVTACESYRTQLAVNRRIQELSSFKPSEPN